MSDGHGKGARGPGAEEARWQTPPQQKILSPDVGGSEQQKPERKESTNRLLPSCPHPWSPAEPRGGGGPSDVRQTKPGGHAGQGVRQRARGKTKPQGYSNDSDRQPRKKETEQGSRSQIEDIARRPAAPIAHSGSVARQGPRAEAGRAEAAATELVLYARTGSDSWRENTKTPKRKILLCCMARPIAKEKKKSLSRRAAQPTRAAARRRAKRPLVPCLGGRLGSGQDCRQSR